MFKSDIFNKPGTEVSAESVKTTKEPETATSLESPETREDPVLGKGRKVYFQSYVTKTPCLQVI